MNSQYFLFFANSYLSRTIANCIKTWYNIFMKELCPLQLYRGMRICVALSGGRDSVALVHYLHTYAEQFAITVSALTCEHGIRGESSLRDLDFVKTFCAERGIPLRVFQADIPARAKAHKRGVEEEGRIFRYECFSTLLEEGEADAVATAHHKDDFAETVLFRLARGTSSAGLCAIAERKGIIRPFLSVTRRQIDDYINENNLPYVEDESNADVRYSRNAIRKEVLPALERAVNGAAENLLSYALRAGEDDKYLQSLAERELVRKEGVFCIPASLPQPLFSRACVMAMKELRALRDYTQTNIEEISRLKELQSGRRVCLPYGLEAAREGGEIVVYRPETPFAGVFPFSFGERLVGAYKTLVCAEERERSLKADFDAFPEDCVIRTRREGDQFTPFKGKEKPLKEYLTDKKIPARVGRQLPLIAKGKEVFAIFDVEISDQVKITKQTKTVCYLTAEKI